jgi:hypothetical protein
MRIRVFALLATIALPLPLMASTFNFNLTQDEHGTSTPPAGSASVAVNLLSSTSATVMFTTVSGYYIDDAFFNVNGDFTVAGITGTQPAYTATADQSLDSYGTMSEEITPNNGHPSTTITITLDAAGATTWLSASNVLTPTCPSNDSIPSCVGGYGIPSPDSGGGYNAGYYAHGFLADATIGTSSTSGSDDHLDLAGYATPTPEPGSLVLVVTGLTAMAGIARRKMQRA